VQRGLELRRDRAERGLFGRIQCEDARQHDDDAQPGLAAGQILERTFDVARQPCLQRRPHCAHPIPFASTHTTGNRSC